MADASAATTPDRRRSDGNAGACTGKTVGDLMRRDFITISADQSLIEARRIMRFARLRHLLVERSGVLVGVLSYRDLLDQTVDDLAISRPGRRSELGETGVEQAMVDSPYVATPDLPAAEAARRLRQLGVGCLPVVDTDGDGPRLIGLITEADLLDAAYGPRANPPRG
jgi:CBS domain-containing protein